MELAEILKDKKVEDFSREELENLATENNVAFKSTSKDATIFKNLVKSLNTSEEEPKKKVKILLPVTGRFKLSESIGDKVEYPASLADELVENKYAEFVK